MASKFVVLSVCLAVATAGLVPQHQSAPTDEPYASYSFNYEVQDAASGDFKSQSERRDGDVVHGEYSLQDPDGYRRVVKYSADADSGFRAVVHRERSHPAAKTTSLTKSPPLLKTAPPPLKAPAPIRPGPIRPVPIRSAPITPAKPSQIQLRAPLPAGFRAYSTSTLIHAPTHTLVHAAPTVHLSAPTAHFLQAVHGSGRAYIHTAPTLHFTPTAHFVNTAPSTMLLKTPSSSQVFAHHLPTVLKTSFSTPQVSYLY